MAQGAAAITTLAADRSAEALADVSQQLVRAVHHAGQIGADVDHRAADGFLVEHRVDAGHREDVGRHHLEELRHLLHPLAGAVAVLCLHQVQCGQHGGPPVGVTPLQPQNRVARLFTQHKLAFNHQPSASRCWLLADGC